MEQEIKNSLESDFQKFKIVLLGDTGIGKSSIIERICSKENISCFEDCNVEVGVKNLPVGNLNVTLQFFNMIDSSKSQIFRQKRVTGSFFKDTTLVILVIDLTQPSYIDTISRWMFEVERNHSLFTKDYRILCLGTKADRKKKNSFLLNSESLSSQMALYSRKFKQNIFYYEVSSKDCNSCMLLIDQIKVLINSHVHNKSRNPSFINTTERNIIHSK